MKEEYALGELEKRFADIIWERAPLSMSELIQICEKEFSWKRTTTYTVLKKLNSRGLFENRNGTVEICMAKEDFYARQSTEYVERSFGGSLPNFLTAFTFRKKLSKEEIAELKKIIKDQS